MLKIGDFSRITRVSVRMLRHYDEIDLLKPQNVDKFSGYRFYSADQIPVVNRINVLKEMGFSLLEICGFLNKKMDSEQVLSLLHNKKREISSAIEKENERLLRVETLIKFIDKEMFFMKYEIAIKTIPAFRVLSLRGTIPEYNVESILWEELQGYVSQNNLKCELPCHAIYHDVGYKERDVDVEVTMCLSGNAPETERIKVRELEAVDEMAIVMHEGPFEEMTAAYHALGVWLESNGYEMNGPTRAIYHKGPWCEESPENYLTEIQAPVRKSK
ncbi:MAG: MerR family transcriptional regulator [Dethiosulfatibacter sp.]|nr:MerR family transcriptional regulator [Dethiosulfatibacter sp.]